MDGTGMPHDSIHMHNATSVKAGPTVVLLSQIHMRTVAWPTVPLQRQIQFVLELSLRGACKSPVNCSMHCVCCLNSCWWRWFTGVQQHEYMLCVHNRLILDGLIDDRSSTAWVASSIVHQPELFSAQTTIAATGTMLTWVWGTSSGDSGWAHRCTRAALIPPQNAAVVWQTSTTASFGAAWSDS